MTAGLPGVGGTLFPGRYLRDRLIEDAAAGIDDALMTRRRHELVRWWRAVSERCGPASGLRALFDLVAMPLFGMLGFRARDAVVVHGGMRARLVTNAGAHVALVLVPWASRAPGAWRDLVRASRDVGAGWCFVLAPPFLSLVDAGGRATRRSVEFVFPAALEPSSFPCFWTLARAAAFRSADGPREAARAWPPASIDRLVQLAMRYQDRVREDLQFGVADALDRLARVPGVRRDEPLVIIYRILFLLFAEARDLVPAGHPIYARAYSVSRLAADGIAGGDARGAWAALAAITRLSRLGCRTDDLIARPFNGRLFARRAAPILEARQTRRPTIGRMAVEDESMRDALVALSSRPGAAGREDITYSDLGVEQLGAVYERVLDLPDRRTGAAERARRRAGVQRHSEARKQTGTFYTPQALAEFVVRRTLAPLVAGASAERILALRVVDPAMGSGAFLVAACRYLAGAYERALVGEGRLAPGEIDDDARAAMRRLIAERCLAGVDVNPIAVQLARLSLWLTTLAHGRPLSFLDHRLRTGNSLVGATPEDLSVTSLRRRPEHTPLPLFDADALEQSLREAAAPLAELCRRPNETLADVRVKEALWDRLSAPSSPLARWRLALDVWCARWFPGRDARPISAPELRAILDALLRGDRTLPSDHLARRVSEAREAGRRQVFFHWPLEFSDVFYDETGRDGSAAGFDAVLGNPPWEMVRRDAGAGSSEADSADPALLIRFIRESGVYRRCDRGHLNLYQPFLERALSICRRGGRVGLIVPWGLAVDDGAAGLRRQLLGDGGLETLVGLDNASGLFRIHRGVRFAVVVAQPGRETGEVVARFGVRTAAELDALPGRDDPRESTYPIRFTFQRLQRVGGPTLRVPDVRHAGDLEILERLMSTVPGLGRADGWAAAFGRELNASDDAAWFGAEGLPVVEGKHVGPYRAETAQVTSRIRPEIAARLLGDGRYLRPRVAYRDVSSVGNVRSLIAAVLPGGVVTTHTLFCLRTPASADANHFLCGVLNSFVLNFIVRMLMGGHVTASLAEELPVPPWTAAGGQRRIARLAKWLGRGTGTLSLPVQARLEAAVAALYGLDARDFERIVERFPLVPRPLRTRAVEELRGMNEVRSPFRVPRSP